jgi:hypothetical protein
VAQTRNNCGHDRYGVTNFRTALKKKLEFLTAYAFSSNTHMEAQRNIPKISVKIICAVAEVKKVTERIQGVSRLPLWKHWQLSGTSYSYRTQTVDTTTTAVIRDAMSPGRKNLYAGA